MTIISLCICIENPYYRLLTNQTIHAPLASSPVISIIVAIDSDGTVSQQDDVVNDSLVLARPNDENITGTFEQDPNNFQLYHYMFPPLQKQDMGQYVIYAGTNAIIYFWYTCVFHTYFSEMNDEQLLNIIIEVNITTEGNPEFVYNLS